MLQSWRTDTDWGGAFCFGLIYQYGFKLQNTCHISNLIYKYWYLKRIRRKLYICAFTYHMLVNHDCRALPCKIDTCIYVMKYIWTPIVKSIRIFPLLNEYTLNYLHSYYSKNSPFPPSLPPSDLARLAKI